MHATVTGNGSWAIVWFPSLSWPRLQDQDGKSARISFASAWDKNAVSIFEAIRKILNALSLALNRARLEPDIMLVKSMRWERAGSVQTLGPSTVPRSRV